MSTSPTEVTGANVRAEMARRKVSQVAVAAHLGCSQAAVSKRLSGDVAFDINELHLIAAFLDVPLAALLPSEVGAA
jgi:predicted transcriptional regulator